MTPSNKKNQRKAAAARRPLLSIVVPVYFNALNLPGLYEKMQQVIFNSREFDYEVIFVDDGSGDASFEELLKLRRRNSKIKIVKLSRNFGSHTAILTGLHYASGDCATAISADLQDPPQIIVDMFRKWREGNKVVLAVRQDREESFLQKSLSNLYYRLMRKLALKNMPPGGFDCFLIDRDVVAILAEMKEKNSTLMGQILWCGFQTATIGYVRQKRELGKSRWTLAKKIKLFVDSFIAFSYSPIRLITTSGFLVAGLGFVLALVTVANKLMHHIAIQGWASLVVLVLVLFGMQFIMLGVIGEYLWRNFDESRKRPAFIIETTLGLNKKP
jgi:dolichol-phosphate mannosyltransferase